VAKKAVPVGQALNVGIRIPRVAVLELEEITREVGSTRSAVCRDLVLKALQERKSPKGENWELKCKALEAQNQILRELLKEATT
jgi:hypothetical protein